MIKRYKLKITKNTFEKFTYFWGYQLYGMLMECITPQYAQMLHQQDKNTISQNIIPLQGKNEAIWNINLFGEEAINNFSAIIDEKNCYHLNNHDMDIAVLAKESITLTNVKEIMVKADQIHVDPLITIAFCTPTSFKSNNEYALFPNVSLIVKSLVNKWNSYSTECIIDDEDALNALTHGIKLTSYKLQSSYYHMKGNKIPGFIGEITLSTRLPAPLMEIWKLLLCFSQFSGVGIKTSLGMGSLIVKNIDKKPPT